MAKEYTDTEICLKCVDENEIMYDESGKYLDKIKCLKLHCPETLYEDVIRNVPQCKDVLLMLLKQRIIMNESGVRFNARHDIAGMQAKIAEINLPSECKSYLRDISTKGYQILKQNHFFNHLVEFDAERSSHSTIFGQKATIVGHFDMLAIMEETPLSTSKPHQTNKKSSRKIDKTNQVDHTEQTKNEQTDFDDDYDISVMDSISELTISSKSLGKAVLTVIVTFRNYISTVDIFRQFLFMHLQNLSRFFFLVFHMGPLVEEEKIVLYEYKPPKSIVKVVKSFKVATQKEQTESEKEQKEKKNTEKVGSNTSESGHLDFIVSQTVQKTKILGPSTISEEITKSHGLDIDQLEAEFRKVKGRHLQTAAPLKDYFRYMVFDCPGVKDHQKDKKARYERYLSKQKKKRELKQINTPDNDKEHLNEPTFTFESNTCNAVFESSCANTATM